jgi:hypothetical protein
LALKYLHFGIWQFFEAKCLLFSIFHIATIWQQ